MTKDQHLILEHRKLHDQVVNVNDLGDKTPRTLLYGYDLNRLTVHIYLNADGKFWVIRYGPGNKVENCETTVNVRQEHLPTKRAYPGRTDFEFALLLRESGLDVTYTTWEVSVPGQVFHGLVL